LIKEALPCQFVVDQRGQMKLSKGERTDLNVCERENAEFVRVAHVPASTESLLAEREESSE